MTYARGLAMVGVLLALFTLSGAGWLVAVSREWASDDLRVGHGNSSFPPQAIDRQAVKP
jgi:hypothetical protein